MKFFRQKEKNCFDDCTENFFNKYNQEKKALKQLSAPEIFLLKNYYLNISNFLLDSVSKNLSLNDNSKILDIGCGSAGYLIFLSNNLKRGRYYGVDISQSAIDEAIKNTNKKSFDFFGDPYLNDFEYNVPADKFEFFKANGKKLPFSDNSFDAVYLVNILHHTYDYHQIIDESLRVLKIGGILILVDLKGHGIIMKSIIKVFFKIVPPRLIKKIFNNDLITDDGDIPLRSNVSFKKIRKILNFYNVSIVNSSTRYLFLGYLLLPFRLIYNYFYGKLPLYFLKVMSNIDCRLAGIFKNKADCFTFVVRKK